MIVLKATDLLVKCLENEGVQYVFGIVGKETLDLVHSITDSSIQFIVVRHEQAAAFMANIYAQLTNKTSVCTATLGPGATNLVTGIGASYLDYGSVVAICGQKGLSEQHKTTHQHINLVDLFKPITKWSTQIKDEKTIPETIRKAFKLSKNEKPGPIYIELPENLAGKEVTSFPIPKSEEGKVLASEHSLKSAKAIIEQSVKPFVLVGNGVIRQNAHKEVQHFVEQLHIPAAHTFTAKGVLPYEHELNFYTFGFSEKDFVVNMVRESDLLITVGLDVVEKLPKDWNIDQKPILHIHSTAAEIDEFYPTQLELVGDIKENLTVLNQYTFTAKAWKELKEKQQRIRAGHGMDVATEGESELYLPNVIRAIQKKLSPNVTIISDVGAHKMEIARIIQPDQPNRVFISNGFASMGVALPGSIAGKLARPNQPVVCVTGDGGFLMNFAELETAKRLGTAIIVIVLSDGMFGLEKKMMVNQQSTDKGVYFSNPDFLTLADSFGIKSFRVKDTWMLEEVIESNLNSDEIILIDVPVRYN